MPQIASLLRNDFLRLSDFIHAEYGIKMPPVKKTLLESRLQKRLRALELTTFKDYCDYLFSPQGRKKELPLFIDKITTNKTDFFREPDHFEHLTRSIVPSIIDTWGGVPRNLRIWSAGCSTGEEPYTLAIVMSEFMENHPEFKMTFSILATDVSMEVLRTAKKAVYHEIRVAPIPILLRKKYLLRNRKRDKKTIKIAPEIRKTVQFGRLNFMDHNFGLRQPVDIIFCRNVIIYFDKPTQLKILNRLCRNLVPGGYFFQGHSESVQGMQLPLKSVYPTIYQKT